MLAGVGLMAWVVARESAVLLLFLPGMITVPVYALVACRDGRAVPFSMPTEEAKSAGRGLTMILAMAFAMVLSGLATWAWTTGWFMWFLVLEATVVSVIYLFMRRSLDAVRWPSLE